MSRVCELTGKRQLSGHKVSHSNIKTNTFWMINLKKKRYYIPELKRTVAVKLSTSAIRTVDKFGGLSRAILGVPADKLSQRLQTLRNQIRRTM